MKIALGFDHAGINRKSAIIGYLTEKGYEYVDYGTYTKESRNYAEYAEKVAEAVARGECDKGILVCGTGIGMSIAANKVNGIRAAVCWNKETAALISQHNNANVICTGARFASVDDICSWIKIFLETKFEERHLKRINKIMEIEQKQK